VVDVAVPVEAGVARVVLAARVLDHLADGELEAPALVARQVDERLGFLVERLALEEMHPARPHVVVEPALVLALAVLLGLRDGYGAAPLPLLGPAGDRVLALAGRIGARHG